MNVHLNQNLGPFTVLLFGAIVWALVPKEHTELRSAGKIMFAVGLLVALLGGHS